MSYETLSEYYDIPHEGEEAIPSLNNNAKNVIIVSDPADLSEGIHLLRKILSAIHLDLENDCTLIQLSGQTTVNLAGQISREMRSKIISFGIPLRQLGFNISATGVLFHLESMDVLNAPKLGELATNQNAKRVLWQALKSLG